MYIYSVYACVRVCECVCVCVCARVLAYMYLCVWMRASVFMCVYVCARAASANGVGCLFVWFFVLLSVKEHNFIVDTTVFNHVHNFQMWGLVI